MVESSRGILYPARLPDFHRLPAPPALADLVQWFWIPEWELAPGRTSRQLLLAHPSSNLVIQGDEVMLSGPTTRASHRDLTGRGWAVGALLRPALVPHLAPEPSALRDTVAPLSLPALQSPVAAAMRSGDPEDHGGHRQRAVDAFVAWLSAQEISVSAEGRLANQLVDLTGSDPGIRTLDDAAGALAVSPRTLQRVARRYIGLTPAALIRRRRLQEAAERARSEPAADLADIAADLGYADHAHLTNEFRRVLGFTPSRYRRENSTSSPIEPDF